MHFVEMGVFMHDSGMDEIKGSTVQSNDLYINK